MITKNILNSIKTTTLGLLMILSALTYTYLKESVDYTILTIFLITGISFMFFPDEFLAKLKILLNKKSNEL